MLQNVFHVSKNTFSMIINVYLIYLVMQLKIVGHVLSDTISYKVIVINAKEDQTVEHVKFKIFKNVHHVTEVIIWNKIYHVNHVT